MFQGIFRIIAVFIHKIVQNPFLANYQLISSRNRCKFCFIVRRFGSPCAENLVTRCFLFSYHFAYVRHAMVAKHDLIQCKVRTLINLHTTTKNRLKCLQKNIYHIILKYIPSIFITLQIATTFFHPFIGISKRTSNRKYPNKNLFHQLIL